MAADRPIVILGAGPTGLGAAWRLNELGHTNWQLFEASDRAGGLAASFVDEHGFTWDVGGHVLFSHYPYFDTLMETALGDRWVEHVREAWVWMRERWIPYPLQNNIWRLPETELASCLEGLLEARALRERGQPRPDSFREWLLASFGRGLCETFLFPYNTKVWAYDPDALDVGWMGERVAPVDVDRVLRHVELRQDDVRWGPNATFRFPLRGGTGAIWNAVRERLPAERLHFNRAAVRINGGDRAIRFADGSSVEYSHLVSTMPLDMLIGRLEDRADLAVHVPRFVHSSSHIVGIGMRGQTPDALKTKCWMYFPEPQVPFYRCTVFSNYSPNNVPSPGSTWSLIGEVSESPVKPVDAATVVDEVVAGLERSRLVSDTSAIVSRWHTRVEYGYPTPWRGRDAVLDAVDAELRRAHIFSRGRFGAWKYEVSNQDHSVMQGVEAIDHILRGAPERTYYNVSS
jgi:protoporphyrinogen oxidase